MAPVVDVFELVVDGRRVLLAHLHEPDTELAGHLDQDSDAGQDVERAKIFSKSWVSTRSGSAMLDVVSVQTAK